MGIMLNQSAELPTKNLKVRLLAGRAVFTIINTRTGNRFTYKIKKDLGKESVSKPAFVSVLTGRDNENDYTYLGCIYVDYSYKHGRKSKIKYNSQSAEVFRWFWWKIGSLPEYVKVYHEGRCLRCGRTLTVPESIETGFGPECAGKCEFFD